MPSFMGRAGAGAGSAARALTGSREISPGRFRRSPRWRGRDYLSMPRLRELHRELLSILSADDFRDPGIRVIAGDETAVSSPDKEERRLIEILRSLAELVAYGEAREEPEYFECFCANAMMALFVSALRCGPAVKTQVVQAVAILFENLRNPIHMYMLLSQDHINRLIQPDAGTGSDLPLQEEEFLSNYVSLLKAISVRLSADTVQFFLNAAEGSFPLFTRSVPLIAHPDPMVRTSALNIALHVFSVRDPGVFAFLSLEENHGTFFAHVSRLLRDAYSELLCRVWQAHEPSAEAADLGGATDIFEDLLYYAQDVFDASDPRLSDKLALHLHRMFFRDVVLEGLAEATGERRSGKGPVTTADSQAEVAGTGDGREPEAQLALYALCQAFTTLTNDALLRLLTADLFGCWGDGDTSTALVNPSRQKQNKAYRPKGERDEEEGDGPTGGSLDADTLTPVTAPARERTELAIEADSSDRGHRHRRRCSSSTTSSGRGLTRAGQQTLRYRRAFVACLAGKEGVAASAAPAQVQLGAIATVRCTAKNAKAAAVLMARKGRSKAKDRSESVPMGTMQDRPAPAPSRECAFGGTFLEVSAAAGIAATATAAAIPRCDGHAGVQEGSEACACDSPARARKTGILATLGELPGDGSGIPNTAKVVMPFEERELHAKTYGDASGALASYQTEESRPADKGKPPRAAVVAVAVRSGSVHLTEGDHDAIDAGRGGTCSDGCPAFVNEMHEADALIDISHPSSPPAKAVADAKTSGGSRQHMNGGGVGSDGLWPRIGGFEQVMLHLLDALTPPRREDDVALRTSAAAVAELCALDVAAGSGCGDGTGDGSRPCAGQWRPGTPRSSLGKALTLAYARSAGVLLVETARIHPFALLAACEWALEVLGLARGVDGDVCASSPPPPLGKVAGPHLLYGSRSRARPVDPCLDGAAGGLAAARRNAEAFLALRHLHRWLVEGTWDPPRAAADSRGDPPSSESTAQELGADAAKTRVDQEFLAAVGIDPAWVADARPASAAWQSKGPTAEALGGFGLLQEDRSSNGGRRSSCARLGGRLRLSSRRCVACCLPFNWPGMRVLGEAQDGERPAPTATAVKGGSGREGGGGGGGGGGGTEAAASQHRRYSGSTALAPSLPPNELYVILDDQDFFLAVPDPDSPLDDGRLLCVVSLRNVVAKAHPANPRVLELRASTREATRPGPGLFLPAIARAGETSRFGGFTSDGGAGFRGFWHQGLWHLVLSFQSPSACALVAEHVEEQREALLAARTVSLVEVVRRSEALADDIALAISSGDDS